MADAPRAGAAPLRRGPRAAVLALAIAAGALLLGSLLLHGLLEPQRASRFLLQRAGAALGLEIVATGRAEYRLRGTPTLVLRDVSVREPGAARELAHADRVLLSVPWATIRALGEVLDARRLELDAPRVDLAALGHWLDARPPAAAPKLPTFADGIQVRDGVLLGDGWRVDGIALALPRLADGEPLHARLQARYAAPPLAVPLSLSLALTDPGALLRGARSGFGASGRITVHREGEWAMPGWLLLSGPLRIGDGGLRLQPARLGLAARWQSGDASLPFALGAHGALRYDGATWLLADAGVALRGRGDAARDPVPALRARGQLALGRRLVLRLQGDIARWPQAWPALPAPLDAVAAPMPFALDYAGATDLGEVVRLGLQRGAAALDARFRLGDVQDWLDDGRGNPLPPLDGRLRAPLLELDGARLEGVDVVLDAPEVDDAAR